MERRRSGKVTTLEEAGLTREDVMAKLRGLPLASKSGPTHPSSVRADVTAMLISCRSKDPGTAEQALVHLGRLAVQEGVQGIRDALAAGTVPTLLHCLSSLHDGVAAMAACSLQFLLMDSEAQDRFRDGGAIPALVQGLRSRTEKTKFYAAVALKAFAKSDSHHAAILSAGAVLPLKELLLSTNGDQKTLFQAAIVLALLTAHAHSLAALPHAVLIPLVAFFCTRISEDTLGEVELRIAISMFLNLAQLGESTSFREGGGLVCLINLLQNGTETLQLVAAALLLQFSEDEGNKKAIRGIGGIDALLNSLREGRSTAISKMVTVTLGNLCLDDEENILALAHNGALELVPALLAWDAHDVLVGTLYLVSRLTLNDDVNVLMMGMELPAKLEVLYETTLEEETKQLAGVALYNILSTMEKRGTPPSSEPDACTPEEAVSSSEPPEHWRMSSGVDLEEVKKEVIAIATAFATLQKAFMTLQQDGLVCRDACRMFLCGISDEPFPENTFRMIFDEFRDSDTQSLTLHRFLNLIYSWNDHGLFTKSYLHNSTTADLHTEERVIVVDRAILGDAFACVKRVFAFFDRDGNGVIGFQELHDALKEILGSEVSSEECHRIMNDVDVDRNGVVDFHEFFLVLYLLYEEEPKEATPRTEEPPPPMPPPLGQPSTPARVRALRKSGSMYKQGNSFRIWRQWWFAVEPGKLSIYRSRKDSVPKNCVQLFDCRVLEAQDHHKYGLKIQYLRGNTIYFYCKDEREMREWIEAISGNIQMTLPV